MMNITAQLNILKAINLKPHFSQLSRKYGLIEELLKNIIKNMKESQKLKIKKV